MEIEYKVQGGEVCASLSGELDESSADYVRLSLDELLKSSNFDTQKLVLDFSQSRSKKSDFFSRISFAVFAM